MTMEGEKNWMIEGLEERWITREDEKRWKTGGEVDD